MCGLDPRDRDKLHAGRPEMLRDTARRLINTMPLDPNQFVSMRGPGPIHCELQFSQSWRVKIETTVWQISQSKGHYVNPAGLRVLSGCSLP